MLAPRFIEELAGEFSANRGLSVTDVSYSSASLSPNILIIKGLYVGVVAGTHATFILHDGDTDDKIKLIRYDRNPHIRHNLSPSQLSPWPSPDASTPVNLSNTSWEPWWAEVGDIIVAAAGSTVPLVLRPIPVPKSSVYSSQNQEQGPPSYLLVGGCLLIDSQLRILGLIGNLREEPGFSRIMFGSAWEKVLSWDGAVREGVLEEFWLV